MLARPLLAAAFGLAASPSLAATVAQTAGTFTLQALGDLPDTVTLEIFDPFLDSGSDTLGPLAFAEADATGDGAASGAVVALAEADATGDGEPGAAFAGAIVGDAAVVLTNTGAQEVVVSGQIEYALLASVSLDAPGDDAFAGALLEVLLDGEPILFEEAFRDADLPGEQLIEDVFATDIVLAPGVSADVSIFLEAFVEVADVSPVPVPAALPLLGAGLGGLVLLGRRRRG